MFHLISQLNVPFLKIVKQKELKVSEHFFYFLALIVKGSSDLPGGLMSREGIRRSNQYHNYKHKASFTLSCLTSWRQYLYKSSTKSLVLELDHNLFDLLGDTRQILGTVRSGYSFETKSYLIIIIILINYNY